MPQESNHYLDRSGTLVSGVFFRFTMAIGDESYGEPVEGTILSRRTPTEAELKKRREHYLTVNTTEVPVNAHRRCAQVSDHVTEEEVLRASYRVEDRGRLADFIENVAASWIPTVISGTLQDSKLTGYRLGKLEPERPRDVVEGDHLHVLNFVGRNCQRPASIRRARNACPHCGAAPLVCQACGYEANPCAHCNEETITFRGLHRGAGDKRLFTDRPDGFVPRILDGKRWDGSDFIYFDFITKRALDWLLSLHAAPFFAEPAMFCTDGMTDEQKKWLERAKRPVEE